MFNRSAENCCCSRGDILGRKQSVFLMLGEPTAHPHASVVESLIITADGTTVPVSVHLTHLDTL